MLDRFDALGPFAGIAKAATGLVVAGILALAFGLVLTSPLPHGVPPTAVFGLLIAGTGGGLLVAGAVTYIATGDAARRTPSLGADVDDEKPVPDRE